MNALGKFGAVCFDCDSTLSRLEGIDELASRYGRKDEVALLTEAAMNGELSIDDVYAKRLSIVRPDREAVAWLGERYVQELVPGARETIEALRRLGKPVYVAAAACCLRSVSRASAGDTHVTCLRRADRVRCEWRLSGV
jgi:phosphoserine phosphatase